MTATGATVTDARRGPEVSRVDVDRLERRYRLVYPLNIFLENARQVVVVSAVGLVIGAALYFLHYALSSADTAPIEIQVFLVTAFACAVVVGYFVVGLDRQEFLEGRCPTNSRARVGSWLVALRYRLGGRRARPRCRDETEGGLADFGCPVARSDRSDRGLFCSLDLDAA